MAPLCLTGVKLPYIALCGLASVSFHKPDYSISPFYILNIATLYSLQLNLATAITLIGLVAITVDYSVFRLNCRWPFPRRLAWFLLLVHSQAACPEISQAKQWSHSSPLPHS